jgi:hypothetical protein
MTLPDSYSSALQACFPSSLVALVQAELERACGPQCLKILERVLVALAFLVGLL